MVVWRGRLYVVGFWWEGGKWVKGEGGRGGEKVKIIIPITFPITLGQQKEKVGRWRMWGGGGGIGGVGARHRLVGRRRRHKQLGKSKPVDHRCSGIHATL
jgi:hypothetical protein